MSYYQKVDWYDGKPLTTNELQQMADNSEAIKNKTDNLEYELQAKTAELQGKLNEMQNKLNAKVTLVHNCMNCGGQLNIEENKPVIHCKYCGSAYIIGTAQIYSTY